MIEIHKNSPELWVGDLPQKSGDRHKYNYGYAFIYGAPELTGATNLAAQACARMGVGLVTVIAPDKRGDLYRSILPPHILVKEEQNHNDIRATAKLYGSGGLHIQPDYSAKPPTVLDADALNGLPEKLSENFVLTPHQGEFDRAFPEIKGNRVERARIAAQKLNCHIVLKGSETIISAPDGQTYINTHASPWLATAGTGDVLAGMITGLLAQNMPVLKACCAAVWIHGESALTFGRYLVASDLPNIIPVTLNALLDNSLS